MLKVLLPIDGSENSNRADNGQITGGRSLILSVDNFLTLCLRTLMPATR